ncbi:MAG TPA: CoA pyrophosphatase [Bacteroidetes bacterium]|nr:CoA pyrophosphatase [Bacteroidota bacterium]
MRYDDLLGPLRQRLAAPLPGFEAHATMAPFDRHADPSLLSIEGKKARRAATLVLLYPGEERAARLVLTQRQPTLRAHSGQVSLPGGSLDGEETPEQAALREGWEEVGVPPEAPEILGRLSPLYIPPSRFAVWPVVAALGVRPAFVPQEEEVAALYEVPVADLLAEGVRQRTERVSPIPGQQGQRFAVPYFALAGQEVWGATAMMLAEFAVILREAVR